MEVRIKSLDRKLSANPVCGIKSAEEVRELLWTVWPRIGGGYSRSMHSFFSEHSYRRISMKELIQKLHILKQFQDGHEEQHRLDIGDDDPCLGPVETCEHCQKIAKFRTKNPNLLK